MGNIEFGDHKPFSELEKMPLEKDQEGFFMDIHTLKNDPGWVVKEQKDKRAWPKGHFDEGLRELRQGLDLAREYLSDALPKTMAVVGEADAEKNKYGNQKKIYLVQERISGKSLLDADPAEIAEHVAELDKILEGMVKIFKDSWEQNLNRPEKTGLMLDFHLRNIFIGKIGPSDSRSKDQLIFLDIFPMPGFTYESFWRLLDQRVAKSLSHKGINVDGPDFPKYHDALRELEILWKKTSDQNAVVG